MEVKYKENDLQDALEAVRGFVTIKEAARRFNVPYTTLQRRVKIAMDPCVDVTLKKVGGQPIFTEEQEQDLVIRIIKLSKFGFGLTSKEIRAAVYRYALDIPNNFLKAFYLGIPNFPIGNLKVFHMLVHRNHLQPLEIFYQHLKSA